MKIMVEFEEEIYKKVENITNTNYYPEGDMVPVDSLPVMIEDLLYEYEILKEELEDLKQDLKENYKPVSDHPNWEYEEIRYLNQF